MEKKERTSLTLESEGPDSWLVTYRMPALEDGERIDVTMRVIKPPHQSLTISDVESACLRRLRWYVDQMLGDPEH